MCIIIRFSNITVGIHSCVVEEAIFCFVYKIKSEGGKLFINVKKSATGFSSLSLFVIQDTLFLITMQSYRGLSSSFSSMAEKVLMNSAKSASASMSSE